MKKILIVDDEGIIRTMLGMIIKEMLEATPIFAEDGNVGYDVACLEQPDLIVTDYSMPEMNGLEFIKKLNKNEETSSIPVIMYTAYASMVAAEELHRLGCKTILSKPTPLEEWVSAITEYL